MFPSQEIIKDTQIVLPEINSIGSPSVYNTMVLKYFIHMGYYTLYTQFCSDLGIFCKVDPLFMRRSKIRDFIESGKIDQGISELNDMDIGLIKDNKDIYTAVIIHKGYEMASLTKNNEEEIIKVIEYVRSNLNEVAAEYEEDIETFLEYLIFNCEEMGIDEKRIDTADRINRLILEAYNVEENDLEKIIEGIVLEENELSKTNKFTEFKKMILD
ncbi:hypothetical protein P3W45_001604 [Vairimorpha bombi]|jgi:hydrogenase maturation factor